VTRAIDLDGPLQGVTYAKQGGVATITLNRPDRGNSLAPPMMAVFKAIWSDVRDDPGVRVAIVAAAGERHFCTGMHFVVDADIVVAADHAPVLDTHVNVGMVGAIENIGLAKRLPLGSALRMTLMGRHYRMSAERAYELGLVDELAETPAEALAMARQMAEKLLSNSPQAMALSKRAVWGSLETGYRDALEAGWALLRSHWGHPDFVEGRRAFGEKREPEWTPDPAARVEYES